MPDPSLTMHPPTFMKGMRHNNRIPFVHRNRHDREKTPEEEEDLSITLGKGSSNLLLIHTYNIILLFLDANKRRQLPAWIREGLEKMEKEKLKAVERERLEILRQQELEARKQIEDEARAVLNPAKSKFVSIYKLLFIQINQYIFNF